VCGVRGADQTPVSPLKAPGIENAFQLTDKVLSGGTPESEAAFKALAELGVRTIISVDGGRPDVEAARKHGLRYIHLPMGYNGAFGTNAVAIALAGSATDGKVFVHCHHGMHRGPAAAAVICQANGNWTPAEAAAWLRKAGTSSDYPGLYRMVEVFKPTPQELANSKLTNFPEVVETPGIVSAMVDIDAHWDALKPLLKAGDLKATAKQVEAATLLAEAYRELLRDPATQQRDTDFQALLKHSERAAWDAHAQLRTNAANARPALEKLGATCSDCHKKFRN